MFWHTEMNLAHQGIEKKGNIVWEIAAIMFNEK